MEQNFKDPHKDYGFVFHELSSLCATVNKDYYYRSLVLVRNISIIQVFLTICRKRPYLRKVNYTAIMHQNAPQLLYPPDVSQRDLLSPQWWKVPQRTMFRDCWRRKTKLPDQPKDYKRKAQSRNILKTGEECCHIVLQPSETSSKGTV